MDINKLCLGCMKEIADRESHTTCPYCGYQLDKKAAPHQLQPGTILKGKYYIGKVLGEGGFGITYIGLDLNLEIPLAIKEFFPNGFVSRNSMVSPQLSILEGSNEKDVEKWRSNFIREAQTLAKFHDLDGIVKVYEYFQENNTAYIVMEYVDGIDLKTYLKQNNGRIPADQAFMMLEPVIVSLEQVHSKGIIHRDISPDNIRLTSNGKMKLLDFGAARDVSGNAEKSLSVMLKHGYAPEEQYRTRGNQGPWSDVYALCATIYRAITGVKPVEAMERLRSDTLRRPSEMGVAINQQQEQALMQGLAVVMENRIQSMKALHAAIYGQQIPTGNQGWTTTTTTATTTNTGYTQAGQTVGYTQANQTVGYTQAGQTVGYTQPVQNNGYTQAGQTVGYTQANQTVGYTQAGQTVGYTQNVQNTGYTQMGTGAVQGNGYAQNGAGNGVQQPPIGGQQPPVGGQQPPAQGGGNGAVIGIAVGAVALVLVVVVAAVALGGGGKRSTSSSSFNTSRPSTSTTAKADNSSTTEKEEKEEKPASSSGNDGDREAAAEITKLQTMNDAGDYMAAIEEILYGDGAKMKSMTDERDNLLEAALAGVEEQCRSAAWDGIGNYSDFEGAYFLVDDTIAYYERLKSDYSGVSYYITEMETLRQDIRNNQLSYFSEEAKKLANTGDLDALTDFCNTMMQTLGDDPVAQEIVEENRIHCIVMKANSIHGSGDNFGTMNYVYDHIAEANYNIFMFELYEHSANTEQKWVLAGNVNQLPQNGSDGYVIEWSDRAEISTGELSSLTLDELRIALYEIPARHGRNFVDSNIQKYFQGKNWYTNLEEEKITFDETVELSSIERENIATIIEYMKNKGIMNKVY